MNLNFAVKNKRSLQAAFEPVRGGREQAKARLLNATEGQAPHKNHKKSPVKFLVYACASVTVLILAFMLGYI